MKKIVLLVILCLMSVLGFGDIYVSGGYMYTSGGMVVKGDAGVNTGGNIIVEGELILESDVFVDGSYTGTGETRLLGNTSQLISGSSPSLTFGNVEFGGYAYQFDVDVSISGTAEFLSGIVVVDESNEISFLNGSTSGTATDASHIEGSVKKTGADDFIYPIGDGGKVGAIGIHSIASGSCTITARYFRAIPPGWDQYDNGSSRPINNISTKEYWLLESESGTVTMNVSAHWADGSFSGIENIDSLYCVHYSANGWRNLSVIERSGSENAGYVKGGPHVLPAGSRGTSPESYVSFGTTDKDENPLPIDLVEFNAANVDGSRIRLSWETASELNIDRFTIYRSDDDISHFLKTACHPSFGSPERGSRYELFDHDIQVGHRYYYWLKTVDPDGTEHPVAFKSVSVKSGDMSIAPLCYPNPSNGEFVLDLSGLPDSISLYSLFIINNEGKVVYNRDELSKGIQYFSLGNYQSGLYHILLVSETGAVYKCNIEIL